MTTVPEQRDVLITLRNRAEAHLQAGTAPKATHDSMGLDALRLLHRLSSDPGRTDDALQLLHELQVHQVELDLQQEEIAASEQALGEELRRYKALYEHAPVACCVVDPDGTVLEGNRAAAELFAVGADALEGRRIVDLLRPENRVTVLGLLEQVAGSGARERCAAETLGPARDARRLELLASRAPEAGAILLACCECGNAASPRD